MNSPFSTPSLSTFGNPDLRDDMCLANARLILPDRVILGAITIEQGVINEIVEGDRLPDGATDCAGDFVLPGLV
ncbi:MAG: alpha-D-ribose 1-methylphosphonate 5-triphosphate diphosphatase, partial [Pseudomonadota bacterium]